MSQTKALHLIVKYGNQLAKGRNTISEHRHVLREHGAVWFGKIGPGIGKRTIEAMIKQINGGKPAYLFLFQRSGLEHFNIHRGKIVTIAEIRPRDEELLIPAYYTTCGFEWQMKLWIKLSSLVRVSAEHLANYHTASSGKKALHTVSRSMASVFVIAEGQSTLDVF
jgi:hypothetical protein